MPYQYRLLLLYLFASAYPGSLRVSEIWDKYFRDSWSRSAFKRAVHYLYYYYQALERAGRGVYKMADWYYEELNRRIPCWRDELEHLLVEVTGKKNLKSIKDSQLGLRKLPSDTNGYHKVPKDTMHTSKTKTIEEVKEYLVQRKPTIYQELDKNEARMIEELVAYFYHRYRQGKPYASSRNPRLIASLIQDEMRILVGSSSKCRVCTEPDPDRILQVLWLGRDLDVFYIARYGGVWKVRLDRQVARELDGVVQHA